LRRLLSLIALLAPLAACTGGGEARNLLTASGDLRETTAAGLSDAATRPLVGSLRGLYDISYRVLPGGPPSRHRFAVPIPKGGHLSVACAIPDTYHDKPGVEFRVFAERKGKREVLATRTLDPLIQVPDRGWIPLDVDLSQYAGKDTEIILETTGFEKTTDPMRALWGQPAITVPTKNDAPLIVLYLVDTLRADHTTVYGYGRNTTPALQAFSKDAVVFDQAVAHASWTKPSVASILTSLLPGQHRAVQLRDSLDSSNTLVSERLSEKGFATAGVIANAVVYLPEANFGQGFDYFAGLHGEDGRPSKLVGGDVVVNAALRWLDTRKGLPSFLFVHTMDPHVPYAPPAPFDRMFEPHPLPDRPAADPRTDYKEPADRERLIAQYDGDIAFGDQEFGRFIEELRSRGLYDRALILFVSDHGEEFLDHGQWLHGRSVFDELIRVPLVVKFPKQKDGGRRIATQVQTLDLVPTIFESLALPLPEGLSGLPLQRALVGVASGERPAVSEISHRGIVAHASRTAQDKYVRRFSPEEDELYFDLTKDPGERANLSASRSERVRKLRGGAEEAMTPNPFAYALRIAGEGEYRLTLKTGGWIEQVETTGFGTIDRQEVLENGRRLELRVAPRKDQPRDVVFTLRPVGVSVSLDGTLNGKPLAAARVRLAEKGTHPPALPFVLPLLEDREGESETGTKSHGSLFAAPKGDAPGLGIWLALPPGRKLVEFDRETQEWFRANGYLGK
jgi:arylsulfatase A-like enzyme